MSIENKEILKQEVKSIKLKAIAERSFHDNLKIIFHFIANKSYKEAEKNIDSLTLKYQSDFELSRLYYLRAVIAEKQLHENEAIKYYEASISKSNKYSDPYRQLGVFYRRIKQDYTRAMEFLKKAIEVNPNDYKAYVRLASVFRVNKNIEEAIILYEKAIEINPDSSLAYNSLGILYDLEKKDILKAIYLFKKAINIDSDLSSVAYAYSNIFRIELLYNKHLDKAFEKEFLQKFKNKDVDAFANYELYKILFKIATNQEEKEDIHNWKIKYKHLSSSYFLMKSLIKWAEEQEDEDISKKLVDTLKYIDEFKN